MTDALAELVGRIISGGRRPTVVGVSGAVAVGKTTIATQLAEAIATSGCTVRIVSTDAFLFSNAALADRELLMRKGFPESYDFEKLTMAIASIRAGNRATIPVYSHAVYDVLPDEVEAVDPTDVLIVEGVVALQHSVRETVDMAIYVDAPESVVRGWFVERFLRLTADARTDPASFYHGFAQLETDQVRAIAEATWDGINGVNLRDHILPSRASADVVVAKGSDHAVLSVHPPA